MTFDENDNKVLTKKIEEALKVKHSTARVYASSIRQLAKLLKIELRTLIYHGSQNVKS